MTLQVSFRDYVWNVDSGLTLDKFDSVVPVNLIQKVNLAITSSLKIVM